MTLKALKKKRNSEKAAFALICEKIENEVISEDFDLDNCQILLSQLCDKFERLRDTHEKILEVINESDYEEEFKSVETDRDLYLALKVKLENKIERVKVRTADPVLTSSNDSESSEKNRKFKLPKLELRKFSGDAREYLGFWSQFSKIHEDNDIAAEDKFQYLAQSIVPNSRAAQLINSFPLTAANYPRAVEQLRERFGREDLLVQIYVRDLLSLVMKNASSDRAKMDLTSLYDSIESKLRALESLGRTKEKFADFLGPLVESCLPESVLRAWERSRVSEDRFPKNSERTLENLMSFLRHEVESDEMIKLAQGGFVTAPVKQFNRKYSTSDKTDISTAAVLVSGNDSFKGKVTFKCIFCEKPHYSGKCFLAEKMSLKDKKLIVHKKKACFACLRTDHFKNNCKAYVKCLVCNSNKHLKLMCPQNVQESESKQADSESTEVTLSNNSNEKVYLQTLCVNIIIKGKKRRVRTLIDSGSQHSYLRDKIIKELKIEPIREEKIIHSLFGGRETEPQSHSVYSVEVNDLDQTFKFCFEVFSEEKICGFVPIVNDTEILQELKDKEIKITDYRCKQNEIDLLIGADVIGKIFTNEFVQLSSGLTAIKTKFGWTVIGKQKNEDYLRDNVLSSISLHARDISVKHL